jgi:L-amino acid N-acyltransferase YncA
LNRFNPRAAYDHVADFSVYVDRNWRGKGVGGQLLDRLIAEDPERTDEALGRFAELLER